MVVTIVLNFAAKITLFYYIWCVKFSKKCVNQDKRCVNLRVFTHFS